jgi:hypothetical protein
MIRVCFITTMQLTARFALSTGNTIYTGFKKIYTGKSQLQTGHIPRGIVGEFDIMTCRDLGNGEVQYFRCVMCVDV